MSFSRRKLNGYLPAAEGGVDSLDVLVNSIILTIKLSCYKMFNINQSYTILITIYILEQIHLS
jgi:hypothetical protein